VTGAGLYVEIRREREQGMLKKCTYVWVPRPKSDIPMPPGLTEEDYQDPIVRWDPGETCEHWLAAHPRVKRPDAAARRPGQP
jgi:hypothetical protein